MIFGGLWHQKNVKGLTPHTKPLSSLSSYFLLFFPFFCVSYQWFNQHFSSFQSCPFYVELCVLLNTWLGLCLYWTGFFVYSELDFHLDNDKEHTAVKTLSLTDHWWPFILLYFHNSCYVVIDAAHAELLSKYNSFFQARLNFILNDVCTRLSEKIIWLISRCSVHLDFSYRKQK